jgi:hypothetical protein
VALWAQLYSVTEIVSGVAQREHLVDGRSSGERGDDDGQCDDELDGSSG